jgi:hypothetical protein
VHATTVTVDEELELEKETHAVAHEHLEREEAENELSRRLCSGGETDGQMIVAHNWSFLNSTSMKWEEQTERHFEQKPPREVR